MDPPSTPEAAGRPSELQERPINTLTEQLQGCTISKLKKREQTTTTPASQARPRTQRRIKEGQENAAAAAAAATAGDDGGAVGSGVTPSKLSCISELQDELSCGICLEICVRPCATPCGHAFCRSCLRLALQHKRQCPKCREAVAPGWQPKVNVALWNTIQLLFPNHAAAAPPPSPPAQQAPAATAGGRPRPGGHRLGRQAADWMAGSSASGGVFAPFRPPRPAVASQADRPRTRTQQRQAESFVMPADLQVMLQGMARATGRQGNNTSQGSHHSSQPAAVASRQLRSTQRYASPVIVTHAAPNAQASMSNGGTDLTAFDDVLSWLSIANSPPQRAAAHRSRSGSSRTAAAAAAGAPLDRRRQRAAAAARVHAAIAADAASQADQEDRDLHAAILASMNDTSNSNDTSNPAGAGAGLAPSRSREGMQSGRLRSSRQLLQRLAGLISDDDEDIVISDLSDGVSDGSQPAAPVSPHASAGASLFGRIHSGTSPQQPWAAHEAEPEDDEWLLEAGAIADRLVASTAAAPQQRHVSSHADPVQQPQSRGTALNRVAATAQQAVDTLDDTLDDFEQLLADLSDFEDMDNMGPTLWQRNRLAGRAGAGAAACREPVPVGVNAVGEAAAAGDAGANRAATGPAADRGPAPAGANAVGEAAAAGAAGGRSALVNPAAHRRRGRARVIDDEDNEPGTAAVLVAVAPTAAVGAVTSTDPMAAHGGTGSASAAVSSNAAAAGASAPQQTLVPAPPAGAIAVQGDMLDVDVLVVLPSPEPQPLLARLTAVSHVTRQQGILRDAVASASEQRQQQQPDSSNSRALSQMVEEALGAGSNSNSSRPEREMHKQAGSGSGPGGSSSSSSSSSRALSQMVEEALGAGSGSSNSSGRPERGTHTQADSRMRPGAADPSDAGDDDDFMPPRPSRRLNAAAAVAAALERQATGTGGAAAGACRGRAGRVVPGLRRCNRSNR